MEYYWNLFSGNFPLNVIFALLIILVIWLFWQIIYVATEDDSGIHYNATERQCLNVITNHRHPCIFNAKYDTASYSGIECTVKSRIPCYVQALWGVPMKELCEFLSEETEVIRNGMNTRDPRLMFSKNCIHSHPSEIIAANEEKVYDFKPKNNIEADILSKRKEKVIYPFVLLMVMRDDEQPIESNVVAVANIIHIPHEDFTNPSHLISQFVKLSSGEVKEVKPIYHSSAPETDDEGKQSEICLVCYNKQVSMVYLPCRHACVCSDCIELCEDCPVCRAVSTGHFKLPDFE